MTESGNGSTPRVEGADAGEPAAWAEVERAWTDEASHRAYLDRYGDLEGLAVAGGHYRDVLAARPDDATALRFRDEILRRATALGLAAMPRTGAERDHGKRVARVAALVFTILAAALAVLAARGLFAVLGAHP